MDEVAQADSGVAVNGNIQYLTGQCPEQPSVVADSTLDPQKGQSRQSPDVPSDLSCCSDSMSRADWNASILIRSLDTKQESICEK